jgi:UDP-2,4-diacetamido-2,4,6-trideoxy-beta-L-altropyranose hydrolase
MRCFALAKAWQRRGGGVTFAVAETIPGIEVRLRNEGIPVEQVASSPGSSGDAEETSVLARRIAAHWVVVDGYQFLPAYHHQLKSSGLRVLMVDDDGRFPEYCADLVLNQNLAADEQMYVRREPYTRLLLGTHYALLRPEFLTAPRSHATLPIAQRLLVTMGGTDPDNVTQTVIEALAGVGEEIETTVIVGAGNPHYEQLCASADRLPKVRLVRDPPDMASIMHSADLAVSAAGSTCWELAYLGVPMILVVLASNQKGIAEALTRRGIALNLGWHANLSLSQVSQAILQLAGDAVRRRAMSDAGQQLVDAKGAERVVSRLTEALGG